MRIPYKRAGESLGGYLLPGPDDDGNQLTESESEWCGGVAGLREGVGVVRGLLPYF